jgi:riboflavin kinase/FMN adenylyltransferase
MEVFRSLPAAGSRTLTGLAIGNFDGVHLGHQAIVSQLKSVSAPDPAVVMTFEPHPREFFAGQRGFEAPARISTEFDRLDALENCGVDEVFIVPFDAQFAAMPAQDFIDDVICARMNVSHLMVGDDFRFGAKRAGDFALLTEQASRGAFNLHRMPTLTRDVQRVSSSLVRDALANGDFELTQELLGRPYVISGEIVRGKQLGRTIGFPTLNIDLPFKRPALSGVFVVNTHGLAEQPLPGVASLGVRPAVESDGEFKLEVHLFDFNRDVYGKTVGIEFLKKLRDEADYESLELLTEQIDIDARDARAFFAS